MNQPEERDERKTDPAPMCDTDVLCSSCSATLIVDELVLEVVHPEPHCEGWRHRHAAGVQRGALK